MNLSKALRDARDGIERNAFRLNATGEAFLPYWLSELNTEATASQIALEKIVLPYANRAKHQLPALVRGLELELNHIAKTASAATQSFYFGSKLLLNEQLREIDTHIKRHQIKSAYVEENLAEFLNESEQASLGQGFTDERNRLSYNMRLMDEER